MVESALRPMQASTIAAPEQATRGVPASDLFAESPGSVSLYEVSPRDGLQNEAAMISLEGKKRLIESLVRAGLRRIEITSFVSPKWVPQLADAEKLAEQCRPPEGV